MPLRLPDRPIRRVCCLSRNRHRGRLALRACLSLFRAAQGQFNLDSAQLFLIVRYVAADAVTVAAARET